MLHRRPPGNVPSAATTPSSVTPPSAHRSQPSVSSNAAYQPLRRPSSSLYPGGGGASGASGYGTEAGAGSGGGGAGPGHGKATYKLSPGLSPSPIHTGGPGYGTGYGGYPGMGAPAGGDSAAGGAYALGLGYGPGLSGGGYGTPGGGAGRGTSFDLGGGTARGGGQAFALPDVSTQEGRERLASSVRYAVDRFRRGLTEAARLDRSWSLVWGDAELRTLVLKSTLINLLSLLLLSLFPLVISPLFAASPARMSPDARARTQEVGMWYNVLLSWPVFVLCFWINASWAPVISKRAQTALHPAHRHQPPPGSTPPPGGSYSSSSSSAGSGLNLSWLFTFINRIVLISDFTLVVRAISLIPLLGRPLALTYMCMINSYYFWDASFVSKRWGLDTRVQYMQDRTAYMIGFGVPATLMSSFGPSLVNMAIFALIYPFFVIQSLLARPPQPRDSLLPSTPSPLASPMNLTPDGSNRDPFFSGMASPSVNNRRGSTSLSRKFELKVPIFFFARFALEGIAWLEAALVRDRRAQRLFATERPGKRLQ